MRKQLVQLANALRGTGLSRSEAFGRAWATIRLQTAMSQQPTRFAYRKQDGSLRNAIGFYGQDRPAEPAKPSPVLVRKYWDVQAGGYRCFRVDRLVLPA